jgi:hypothetical protein
MAQDLAILGRESAALGQQIGQPIANRVTRRLVQEFGARSRSGALTRADDRCLLADEGVAAAACAGWIVRAASAVPAPEAAGWLEAATQISRARRLPDGAREQEAAAMRR